MPEYVFNAGNGLFVDIELDNGKTERVVYVHKSQSFLDDNALDLLEKNNLNSGYWQPYDDPRRDVLKSWRLQDSNYNVSAFALLSSR